MKLKCNNVRIAIGCVFMMAAINHCQSDQVLDDLAESVEAELEADLPSLTSVVAINSLFDRELSDGAKTVIQTPEQAIERISEASNLTEEGKANLEDIWAGRFDSINEGVTARDFVVVAWIVQSVFLEDAGAMMIAYLEARMNSSSTFSDLLLMIILSSILQDSGHSFERVPEQEWLKLDGSENIVVRVIFYENAHRFIRDSTKLAEVYERGKTDLVPTIRHISTPPDESNQPDFP